MNLKSAQKTPPNFFEEQSEEIWKQSQVRERRVPSAWSVNLRYAAIFIGLVIGGWIAINRPNPESCESFACLWEKTKPEDIQLNNTEIELWLEDDLLFESLTSDDELLNF